MKGRTIASILRTLFYGGSAGTFAGGGLHLSEDMAALMLGALLADYVTWITIVVIRLPGDTLHAVYDLLINLLFAAFFCVLLGRGGTVPVPPLEAGPAGMAVVAFGLMLVIKTAFYGFHYAMAPVEEDA